MPTLHPLPSLYRCVKISPDSKLLDLNLNPILRHRPKSTFHVSDGRRPVSYLQGLIVRRGWVLALFLILPLLSFPEIVFGDETLYWTDLSWIHFPRHTFAAEEWLAGRVPLWDPYEDTGLPLLAETQVGVLYPLSAIFLSPLSTSLELSFFILIHFTLAALFTFMLARSLELSPVAATVAGLAYGFGGFLMAQVPNLNIMTGAVWLPVILFAAIQVTRRRSWPAALLAGIPLTLQILTAQPQIVFYSLIIFLGYGGYRIGVDLCYGDDRNRGNIRYALRTSLLLGTTILCGLLLAAPQLLPTLELQQLSVRSQERGLDFVIKNSLPPVMGLNLILPSAFGNNVVGFKGGDPFQEDFIYLGFIPLWLTFFSWPQRHKRDVAFFFVLLLGGLLLALGGHTPLYAYAIQYLPGFDLFRIPARWLIAVNLALAILAGLGLDTVLRQGLSRRALAVLWLSALLLGGGLLIVWVFRADLLAWSSANLNDLYGKLAGTFLTTGFSPDPIYRDRLLLRWAVGLSLPPVLLAANLVIALTLFSLFAAKRLGRQSFALLVIAAISFDLAVAGGTTINPTKPAEWWGGLSGGARYILEHGQDTRVFPLGMGSEEATVSHLGQYFPSVYGVYSAGGHGSSLRIARYDTFLHEVDPVQAIQVVGAGHLLTLGQMGADVAATYPLVYSDETSFVYENTNPLPRALIVHQAIQVENAAEALAHFQARAIDPRQTAILEADTPVPALPQSAPPTGSTAAITNQHPQLVEIEASLTGDGYLILLDTFYPGWVASVDGQASPIYRANYIGRAVFLPAGEHIVRFEYRPLSFRLGVWVALGMLMTMGAVIYGM